MTDTAEPEGDDGPVAAMAKRFADASAWAVRPDRIAVLRKALRGRAADVVTAAAALDFGPVDLPGPTGEANSLALHPRGNVLCLGPGAECLLDQVVLALAAGNSVIAAAAGARAALGVLASARDLPLIVIDGAVDDGALKALALGAVAYCGPAERMRVIRRILAGRDGPIVRLVSERLAAEAYVHERAVCVDTTAAGGNASLLAGAG